MSVSIPQDKAVADVDGGGGVVVGCWPVARVPHSVSGTLPSPGAPLLLASALRVVVEKDPLTAAARAQLVADEQRFEKWKQSLIDDDARFSVQDPRSVDVADGDSALAKQVRALRRSQARLRKEKAEMEARRAAMDAERAKQAQEKLQRRELRVLAQQQREANLALQASQQVEEVVPLGELAAGVNPGLTVPLPAPPHAAHMSPDERAAVREAMKKRASRPQHQALSPVRADALPAGSLTPARPAGAKPSQYAPAAAAAAGKKRLAGSHLGLSLALSAADGAVAGVGSLAGPAPSTLRCSPPFVRFGCVRVGSVARVEVLIENTGEAAVPCTVPEHYLEHCGTGNSVCVRMPHGDVGLLQSGDSTVIEVELIAGTAGQLQDIIEMQSVGFSVVLSVDATVVSSPSAVAIGEYVSVLSASEAAEVKSSAGFK